MKKFRTPLVSHAALWLALYIFWIMVFQKRAFALSHTATVELCYLFFIAVNFYFNTYIVIPKYLYALKYLQYFALLTAGIVFTALLRVPVATYLNANYFLVGKPQPSAPALFFASLLNISIWTIVILAAKVTRDHFHFQEHLEEIKMQKSRAELDLLNAEMNPHFLFNSIHSIYGQIDKNNTVARKLLITFSEMLRYQLYQCNCEQTSIEKELAYLENYVALQRTRMEKDLEVNLFMEENVNGLTIAPLLFISFVENAFKYVGSSDVYDRRIEISIVRRRQYLCFTCMNTKNPIAPQKAIHSGIGLNNTRRRLALHYPDKHDLHIIDNEQFYQVNLTIEMHETEVYNN